MKSSGSLDKLGLVTGAVPKRKPKLLIVEDDPGVRVVLARAFKGDYEIHEAKDGAEGLVMALKIEPDVIITDQRMPEMTGIEFLTRIRNALPNAIRVLVTGYTDYAPLVDALNVAHVHHYFEKPFHTVDVRTVVDVLHHYNELKQQQDGLLDRLRSSVGGPESEESQAGEKDLSVNALIRERTRRLEESNKALREANDKLHELAVRDGLTGLFNHRSLMENIELEVARSRRYQREFSLLFIDLDDFKRVNDRYGHATGDRVLMGIAGLLFPHPVDGLRSSDFAARYGGEEFCVILPETPLAGGEIKAERIRAAAERLDWRSSSPPIDDDLTLSIGVAAFPDHGVDSAAILAAADMALYRAKHNGKNQVQTPPEV